MVWARILLGAGIAALFVQSPTHAEVRIGVATPLTGGMAWFGEQQERGVAMAVAELNQEGGLLGEPIEVVLADDYCDAEQGVAAARKLIDDGVVFVAGHLCSGAAIPASALYEEAGIVMIAPTATNPKLTEQGFSNVFRVVNRDTEQARLAGDYLAEQWADAKIAILHDGTVYGRGLAEKPGDSSTSAALRKPNSARSSPVSPNTPRRLPRSRRRELRRSSTAVTPLRPL
jgi:branched-chain amino acid transport system substrate-binding protein